MSVFAPRPAGSFSFREILYGKSAGVARITINRPDRYNAYSTACLEELAAALRDAAFDDAVGVIVLTGAGDRAFCTGGRRQGVRRDVRRGAARLLEVHGALPRLHRRDPLDRQARGRADQRRGGRRRKRDGAGLRSGRHRGARLRRPGRRPRRLGRVRRRHAVAADHGGGQASAGDALHEPPDSGAPGPRVGARQPRGAVGAAGRRSSCEAPRRKRSRRRRRERTATRSTSSRLDEEVDRPRAGAAADVSRVRALHQAAGQLLEGLLVGAHGRGTPRTGSRSTTPTTSPSRA